MSYVAPADVVDSMVEGGQAKASHGAGQLILRSALAAFILGGASALAITVAQETGVDIVGALVFPLGLTIVILLGLELVTGNFALIPLAVLERRATLRLMARNFGWVIVGHALGGAVFAALIAAFATRFGSDGSLPLIDGIRENAIDQTLGYQELGAVGGPGFALLSGVLCNFFVALGVVLAMTSTSTTGKVVALWPPIVAFYALDLEHSVVNLVVIPAAMMMGAPIGVGDWLLWNQLPVLAGNALGGFLLVGLPLYAAFRARSARHAPLS